MTPINNTIPVNEPLFDGNEKKYINECIDSGWVSSEGEFVGRFEKSLAETVNRKYGIAVSNGTAALCIAVAALNIGAGDEVILPSFTIISCIMQIIRSGATPVLVDSDPVTWNMDIDQVRSKINDSTKAIMVVHIYGLPVDLGPILALADEHGLNIIEDAAEMHGQRYNGKPCGSFGDISIFSFYPNKHITTGEGGMILTNNEDLADRCRSLRNLCFGKTNRFSHDELGWNYRMTNLQAALGLAQLECLDQHVKKKRLIGEYYTGLLSDIDCLQLPIRKTIYADNIYWVYGVVLRESCKYTVNSVRMLLSEHGIGTRPFFWPMHLQPVLIKQGMFKGEQYPVAEHLSTRGFYLPSGLTLSQDNIKQVAATLREFIQ